MHVCTHTSPSCVVAYCSFVLCAPCAPRALRAKSMAYMSCWRSEHKRAEFPQTLTPPPFLDLELSVCCRPQAQEDSWNTLPIHYLTHPSIIPNCSYGVERLFGPCAHLCLYLGGLQANCCHPLAWIFQMRELC